MWPAWRKMEILYRSTGCRDLKQKLECCDDDNCAWIGKNMSKNFPCQKKTPNVIDSCAVNKHPIRNAFDEFLKKFDEKELKANNFDSNVVYKRLFAPLIEKQIYTTPCKDSIRRWLGPMGQMSASGKPTIRKLLYSKQEKEQEEGKQIFQGMYECAGAIDIPQKILFRGFYRTFERSTIERMTATTMSLGIASSTYGGGPLVLLYVPNQKVFGLVVSSLGSERVDTDSEILLLNPHVQEIKDEKIRLSFASKFRKLNEKYGTTFQTEPENVYIYEYLGYFPEENSATKQVKFDDEFRINNKDIEESVQGYNKTYYIDKSSKVPQVYTDMKFTEGSAVKFVNDTNKTLDSGIHPEIELRKDY